MEENKSEHRAIIRIHYFIALIVLLHNVFFVVYWFAVERFRAVVDKFIGDALGVQMPYITILMILSTLLGVWSLVRFIRLWLAVRRDIWNKWVNNWFYLVTSVIFILIFYIGYVIILRENPSQRGVIVHLLNLTRLGSDVLLFILAAIWLRRLILYLRGRMMSAERRWLYTGGISLSLVTLVVLWLIPTLFPPNWAYQGDLPSKPALLAHRGASMLAPENTLAAIDLAAAHQAFGFETDLRISLDGVPFLMHDDTLERTTNIAEVFPQRISDDASDFTMDELQTLNAGLWFIQKDPYGTIDAGKVSQNQLSINQGQKIPTFLEALEKVKEKGMVILFDMRYPPQNHPYYDEYFDIVLKMCRESGLNGDVWLLANRDQVTIALEEAPQKTRVVGLSGSDLPDAQVLLDLGYEIVNVDTGIRTKDIHAYRDVGLGVNIYTIDEPWLFSQFWLAGVTSVTTNNIQELSQLTKPSLNLPYSTYLLFWGLFGIIVAIWLASSHPEPEPEERWQMETPDLMDFAEEDDQKVISGEDMADEIEVQPPDTLWQDEEDLTN